MLRGVKPSQVAILFMLCVIVCCASTGVIPEESETGLATEIPNVPSRYSGLLDCSRQLSLINGTGCCDSEVDSWFRALMKKDW